MSVVRVAERATQDGTLCALGVGLWAVSGVTEAVCASGI